MAFNYDLLIKNGRGNFYDKKPAGKEATEEEILWAEKEYNAYLEKYAFREMVVLGKMNLDFLREFAETMKPCRLKMVISSFRTLDNRVISFEKMSKVLNDGIDAVDEVIGITRTLKPHPALDPTSRHLNGGSYQLGCTEIEGKKVIRIYCEKRTNDGKKRIYQEFLVY